jgi:hypothetical protein
MTMVFVCCLYFSEILFLFLHLPLQFLLAYHQLNGIVNLMIEFDILAYQLNGIVNLMIELELWHINSMVLSTYDSIGTFGISTQWHCQPND